MCIWDLSHVSFGPHQDLGRTELGLIFLEAVRPVTNWVPGYRFDVAATLKRKSEGAKLLQTATINHSRNLQWGARARPRVPITRLWFLHIDRWRRPKAEEPVARGKALGVLS